MNEKFISTKEVAEILGVHRNTIKRMALDGRLQFEDWGTKEKPWRRIIRKSLDDFLRKVVKCQRTINTTMGKRQ